MRFTFTVEVDLEHEEGRWASRAELADQIVNELENADPSSLDGEAGGVYNTTVWEVSEQPQPKGKKR